MQMTDTRLFVILSAVFLLMLLPAKSADAQVSDTGEFLQVLEAGALSDVELMLNAYSRPYAEGLGAVSNSGWVSSAGSHGILGFDLRLSLGIAAIPDGKNSFDLSTLGMSNIRASDPNETINPTISGTDGTDVGVTVFADVPGFDEQQALSEFTLPSGTDFAYTPAPMVQLSAGIPKNTDLMLRFVPEIGIGDYGDFSLFGFGVKHELNQWIPAPLPIKLSVMGGYTNIDLSGSFTVNADRLDYDEDPNNLDQPATWDGQQAVMNSKAWNLNVLAGKSLGPLSVYAGLGMQNSNFELSFDGQYPFLELDTQVSNGEPELVKRLSTIEDPVRIDLNTGTIFRGMAGASFKMLLIKFNLDLTYAEYPVLNAGASFTFR
jgi:hypothetical protein